MRLHVATVSTTSGILVLAAALTEDQVDRRVAEHVRRNADHVLWPAESRQVRELLDRGRLKEAIGLYFSRVGHRWDREFLHTEVVDLVVSGGEPEPSHRWAAELRAPGVACEEG